MTAKVSVIIPVYNTAKYLKKCVDSVLAQTLKDIEIVLVDDGSTDGVSPEICDEYAGLDSRIKVVHKENGGLISAWTRGVLESSAGYVFFVDSDDWIDPDMLGLYYDHVDASFADGEIIAGNCIIEMGGKQKTVTHGLKPGDYTGVSLDSVRCRILGEEVRPVTASRCMKLFSKKLILDNMKYCNKDITMAEDMNITLPCLCDCKRLFILEGAYSYHYRIVTDSMAHGYNSKLLDNVFLTKKTFRNILRIKKITNADSQIDREFVIQLLYVMRNELRGPGHDTARRVRRIFCRKDIRKKMLTTPVELHNMANRLLYFTAQNPNPVFILFAKLIIRIFDKLTK